MHIPDGVLDLWMIVAFWVIVIIAWVVTVYTSRKTLNVEENKLPLLAIMTAMVFALQMLNFPIVGGTSGHLIGFVLIAIILSPSQALLALSTILAIQALIFADGGLLALSANVINMGLVAMIGYFIYYAIRKIKDDDIGLYIGAFIGAYCSVVIASIVAGIEIGTSTLFPYGIEVTIPAMLFWHIFIALGEAAITVAIIVYLKKNRPDLIPQTTEIKLWW
ncbi:MAG: energy-coupling factor ABC transporter permease [Candidatus Helarchaeota archaeon]